MVSPEIRERTVYVYSPSSEIVLEWKEKAKKSNVSLSDFVVEHVLNSLRQEEGEEGYKARAELLQDLRARDESLQKLSRENEVLRLALERVENAMRNPGYQPLDRVLVHSHNL